MTPVSRGRQAHLIDLVVNGKPFGGVVDMHINHIVGTQAIHLFHSAASGVEMPGIKQQTYIACADLLGQL